MTKKEAIVSVLDNLEVEELICIYNEYLDNCNRYDDHIYSIDSLDEVCHGQTAEWIANRIFYGDYHPLAQWFIFNGYGNIQSIWGYEINEYIDALDIADYCIDNDDNLYNDDIREILDGSEEYDEE